MNLAKFDTIENIRVSNHQSLNLIRIDLDILEIRTDSEIVNKVIQNFSIIEMFNGISNKGFIKILDINFWISQRRIP